MATKVLLVGLASDGPSLTPYQPQSVSDLWSTFGGGFFQRFYNVSPTATSLTLDFNILNLPSTKVDYTKNNYLYNISLSPTGNIITFESMGGTGHTVDLNYDPYFGENDVVVSGNLYYNLVGSNPWICRIGGSVASGSIGSWTFESVNRGSKYNSVYLSFTATGSNYTLTVSGLNPNYGTNVYNFTTQEQLLQKMQNDRALGLTPVYCTYSLSTIPTGSIQLTGGSDGTMSDSEIAEFLLYGDIPLDVTHVCFLSTMTSGAINAIISNYYTDINTQPRFFFFSAPSYYTSTNQWLSDQRAAIPYAHNMVGSVVGELTLPFSSKLIDRQASEIAAIIQDKFGIGNLTNMPLPAYNFTPVLDENDLNLLYQNGWMVPMRYILNDISVYQACTSLTANTYLFSSKVAEISALVNKICFGYVGQNQSQGLNAIISSLLQTALSNVTFFSLNTVSVTSSPGSIYVSVDGNLPNEILQISLTVNNK